MTVKVLQPLHKCPMCKDPVDEAEPQYLCRRCLTRHHPECWTEIGQCAVFGCQSQHHIPYDAPAQSAVAIQAGAALQRSGAGQVHQATHYEYSQIPPDCDLSDEAERLRLSIKLKPVFRHTAVVFAVVGCLLTVAALLTENGFIGLFALFCFLMFPISHGLSEQRRTVSNILANGQLTEATVIQAGEEWIFYEYRDQEAAMIRGRCPRWPRGAAITGRQFEVLYNPEHSWEHLICNHPQS